MPRHASIEPLSVVTRADTIDMEVRALRRWDFTRRADKIRWVIHVNSTKVWHIPGRWIHFLFRILSRVRGRGSL
jgi:hypothetical protein